MAAEGATETDVAWDEARLLGGDWAQRLLGKKCAARPQSQWREWLQLKHCREVLQGDRSTCRMTLQITLMSLTFVLSKCLEGL